MMRWLLGILLLLAYPVGLLANPSEEQFVALEAGEPIHLRPDRAYMLFRMSRGSQESRACVSANS